MFTKSLTDELINQINFMARAKVFEIWNAYARKNCPNKIVYEPNPSVLRELFNNDLDKYLNAIGSGNPYSFTYIYLKDGYDLKMFNQMVDNNDSPLYDNESNLAQWLLSHENLRGYNREFDLDKLNHKRTPQIDTIEYHHDISSHNVAVANKTADTLSQKSTQTLSSIIDCEDTQENDPTSTESIIKAIGQIQQMGAADLADGLVLSIKTHNGNHVVNPVVITVYDNVKGEELADQFKNVVQNLVVTSLNCRKQQLNSELSRITNVFDDLQFAQ